MKKIDVIERLEQSKKSFFTGADLKKLLKMHSATMATELNRLTKAGILTRIKRDLYVFAWKDIDDFELANNLYRPSYISLESALAFYGVLLQVPYSIFSVTPRRAKTFYINNKEFRYIHIDKKYFYGYERQKTFLIARQEKAIIDTLFIASFGKASADYDEWILSRVNKKVLRELSSKIKSHQFQKRIHGVFS